MPRPPEPAKRDALLDRCFAAALEGGSLELSLDALALAAGTSARMLVYHFGSKVALDRALVGRLEALLRARFDALAGATPVGRDGEPAPAPHSLADVGAALWDELTAPAMRGLLRLTASLRHRALGGDAAAARAIAVETDAWRDALTRRGVDAETALALVLLADGAASDYLLTGDPARGRRAIAVLLRGR